MPCRYRPMAKRKQLELLPNVLRVHAHYAQETSVSAFRSPYPALTRSSCHAVPCRAWLCAVVVCLRLEVCIIGVRPPWWNGDNCAKLKIKANTANKTRLKRERNATSDGRKLVNEGIPCRQLRTDMVCTIEEPTLVCNIKSSLSQGTTVYDRINTSSRIFCNVLSSIET